MTATKSTIERDLCVLTGRVEEMGNRLATFDRSFAEMRRENAEDHAAVVARLERIDQRIASGLEAKADRDDVEAVAVRVDSLEAERDKRIGRIELAGVAKAIAALVIAALSYLAGSGVHF